MPSPVKRAGQVYTAPRCILLGTNLVSHSHRNDSVKKERALSALDAIVNLGEVAGNHSRFLFDFSPESIVLRLTHDPAPRILYCFEEDDSGQINADELVRKIESGDIDPNELFIGGRLSEDTTLTGIDGMKVFPGVKGTIEAFKTELETQLSQQ